MSRGRVHLVVWGWGFLCFFSSLIYTGYDAIGGNRAVSLALVEWLLDPALYPSDPIRDTFPHYVSVLWWIVAWLARYFPLESLEFVLFLLFRALLFYAAYRLAQSVLPGNLFAGLSSMAAMALGPQPVLAEGTIVVSILEQSSAAVPFVFLALADFIQKRYWLSAVWLGIVANLTVLYAAYTLVYLGVIALLLPDYRREWRVWMKWIGLFFIVSLPAMLLLVDRPQWTEVDIDLWYKVHRFRSAHHLYPLTFPLSNWTHFLVGCIVMTGLSTTVKRFQPLLAHLHVTWLISVALALGTAFAVVHWIEVPMFTSSQPAKAVDLLVAPASVLVVCAATQLLENALQRKSLLPILLHILLWTVSVNLWSFTVHPKVVPFLFLVIAAGLSMVLRRIFQQVKREAVLAISYPVLTFGLMLTLALFSLRQLQANRHILYFASSAPIYPLAVWAERNTPREAIFLIPPGYPEGWSSFRALSKRGVFVTWKDGTHVLFAPGYTEEWVNRMAEIGFDIRQYHIGLRGQSPVGPANVNRLYFKLRDADVRRIASRYRVDYWIVPTEHPSAFREVFRHGRWKVLQVNWTHLTSSITPTSQPRRESHR
jgi:hypothetical protein